MITVFTHVDWNLVTDGLGLVLGGEARQWKPWSDGYRTHGVFRDDLGSTPFASENQRQSCQFGVPLKILWAVETEEAQQDSASR